MLGGVIQGCHWCFVVPLIEPTAGHPLDGSSTLCYVVRMRRFIEWLRYDWQGLVGLLAFVGVYALAVVFQW